MDEKSTVKKQLIKNTLFTFITFTILVIIFDFSIYKRAEQLLYKDIDNELKQIIKDGENISLNKIVLNPRIVYVLRDMDGNVLNPESIGRIYDEYLDDIKFDSKNLNNLYTLEVNNKYTYRGITILAYSKLSNEIYYIQLITNVDGEIESLKNLEQRLFSISIIILITSMIISYFLSRKTLKPIIESWEKQTEFIQNAAHELRTPLTIIQAKQQLLLQEPDKKIIEKSEDINLTINETRRLGKLVKELMLLATADSSILKLKKEIINIDKFISEIAIPYVEYAEIQNKKLTMNLNYNKNINIDINKISQLIIILLDNAIKYTKEGETINLSTFYKDGKCNIEVSDTGIGITDEQKKHIFERFYRADKARTRETGGTGLGLSIAKTIVKLHGGSIKVSDNNPKGTKFLVKI